MKKPLTELREEMRAVAHGERDAAPLPSKAERQAAWAKRVEGLPPEQANRAASIIPHGAPIKVIRWPKL